MITTEQARALICDAVGEIAPEVDPTALRPDTDLIEELELDSIDLLALVEKLSERFGYRIDEDDYHQLHSLETASAFLAQRSAAHGVTV